LSFPTTISSRGEAPRGRRAGSFETRSFEARSSLATWLHRIAVNQVLARHAGLAAKLERLASEAGGEFPPESADEDGTPPLDLERAIEALPDGARHVLVLVGIYGYSHEEAAQSLGVAAGTCRAHLHRARRLLGERLDLAETLP
jgi:RNA polymerase sigma-70 factor (ECF subfamily)